MKLSVKYLLSGALLCGSLGATSGSAHAASYRWVGPNGGAWNNSLNWFPLGVPGAADSATIDAQRIVTVPADVTLSNLTVGLGGRR